jgi:hypothetical protein
MPSLPLAPVTLALFLALEGSPSQQVFGVIFLALLVLYRWLER